MPRCFFKIGYMCKIASDGENLFAITPVTNLSKLSQQIQTPPFFYQTISVLTWAVWEIWELYGDEVVAVLSFAFGESRRLVVVCPCVWRRWIMLDRSKLRHVLSAEPEIKTVSRGHK